MVTKAFEKRQSAARKSPLISATALANAGPNGVEVQMVLAQPLAGGGYHKSAMLDPAQA